MPNLDDYTIHIGWPDETGRDVALALGSWLREYFDGGIKMFFSDNQQPAFSFIESIGTSFNKVDAIVFCFTSRDSRVDGMHSVNGENESWSDGNDRLIIPFLFDVQSTSFKGPLSLVQPAASDEMETRQVVKKINDQLGAKSFNQKYLEERFEKLYPKLKKEFEIIRKKQEGNKSTAPVDNFVTDQANGREIKLAAETGEFSLSSEGVSLKATGTVTDKLDLLRAKITPTQQEVINEIWQHYRKQRSAIPSLALYRKFGETTIRETLNQLGKGVIREERSLDQGIMFCSLTFLGGLLTSLGLRAEDLLAKYLKYALDLFVPNGGVIQIQSNEIRNALNLTQEQTKLLGNVVSLSPFRNGGSYGEEEWQTNLPLEIEEIYRQNNLRAYIRKRALEEAGDIPLLLTEPQDGSLSQEASTPLQEAIEASILPSSISDRPAAQDALGFAPYVEAIAEFLTNPATKAPLTLSIEGKWGSGKSSFMLQLKNKLTEQRKITIDFNAWRHDKEDALWAAFATQFLDKLAKQLPFHERLLASLKLVCLRFNWKDGWLDVARAVLTTIFIGIGLITVLLALGIVLWKGLAWVADIVTTFSVLQTLIKVFGIAGYITTLITILSKLKSFTGNPFKADFAKYIEAPNYKNRIAFIEQFHEDFDKIVKAYAGNQTVYVFIDDLDRCEAPKAADLMQAINLMISDAAKLVFIIGMDREMVAASLAVKHEKLIPYFTPPPATSEKKEFDASGGLEYGYNFIEKFIQLPFLVPRPVKTDIQHLLAEISGGKQGDKPVELPSAGHEPAKIEAPEKASTPSLPESPTTLANESVSDSEVKASSTLSPQQIQRREFVIREATEDSTNIRDIVLMVAPALEYNPRRLKQFINLFRLKTIIAVRTGLFDEPENAEQHDPLALEQLGKFVAIGLRWPRLLADLDVDRSLLTNLQHCAVGRFDEEEKKAKLRGWEQRAKLLDLLRERCVDAKGHPDQEAMKTYGLVRLNVDKLLQVSPRTVAKTQAVTNNQTVA